MRFVKDGPDVPDRLLQAHEEGRVVLFCGAGISYPAGLPGFGGLVDRIYEALGEKPNPTEQSAIKEKRFDATIDLLERRVRNRALVREKIREILTPADLSKPRSTATHRALLTLAKTQRDQTRLVTTNCDRIFCAVAPPDLPSFAAPLLPIPKKSRWHGLVYLHGLLPENNDASALNNLVVSSGDFGLAYLTERWASRFVTELFRGYTVCFVGYSIGDPVLRYMLDALSADRLLGEYTHEVFAFASFEWEHEVETQQDWRAKGVTPILYREIEDHDFLHKTLQAWANDYRDGLIGKRYIITHEAAALPSPVQGDGQIGRVLWAMTEPSGVPARAFAELEPPPPVEWLEIFSEPLFTPADLPRFGITPNSSADNPKNFSLLNRPIPSELGAWMSLVSPANPIWGAVRFDDVMFQIARWLVRHLDKPEVLRWVVANGSSLHPQFCDLIRDRLHDADIPRSLSTVWRLICAGFAADIHHRFDLYDWARRFKVFGWNASTRAELRRLLQPLVRFREPFHWEAPEDVEADDAEGVAREPRIKDYVDWEITLRAGEYLSDPLDEVKKLPDWPRAAVDSLSDFTTALKDALDLMAELEGASEQSDLSYLHRPSIEDHPQNRDFREWTSLIELCRDAWLLASDREPRLARAELERWKLIKYPLFRRLVFFAAANSPLISPSEALASFLEDDAWWLWSVETQREAFRLLVWLAPRLDEGQRTELCNAILTGPPRSMLRDDLEAALWTDIVEHEIWLRLEKLKEGGAALTPEAEESQRRLSDKHPQWQLQPEERDEFPTWMESGWGGSWIKRAALPRERRPLADALAARPSSDIWYEDDWREICQTASARAITALMLLTREDKWPIDVWREALQVFSEEKLIECAWRWLGLCLLRAPKETVSKLLHTLSWWLRAVTKIVPQSSEERWLTLIDRVLDCTVTEDTDTGDDPVSRAINHPVGHITEALIRWWYRKRPKAGDKLPGPLTMRLGRIADPKIKAFGHGRIIMAARLGSLYLVDPDWTAKNLLPYFDWNAGLNEARAVWEGYLWSPRIPAGLLDAFKVSFLATADHYNELGEHNRQYASLLTVVALEGRERFTTNELRHAFNTLPVEGLAEAAGMLARALADAGDRREEYWSHRVRSLISGVWPKSADRRSGNESAAFAKVCIRSGSLFLEAFNMLRPLLRQMANYHSVVKELAQSNLTNHYPLEALILLNAIVDTSQQWPPSELQQCLEQIGAAEPHFKEDRAYQRLLEYVTRFGSY